MDGYLEFRTKNLSKISKIFCNKTCIGKSPWWRKIWFSKFTILSDLIEKLSKNVVMFQKNVFEIFCVFYQPNIEMMNPR